MGPDTAVVEVDPHTARVAQVGLSRMEQLSTALPSTDQRVARVELVAGLRVETEAPDRLCSHLNHQGDQDSLQVHQRKLQHGKSFGRVLGQTFHLRPWN